MAFLELDGITKYFGQLAAVDHISLSVEQGEFLTLLGPSGCGKTTILRMVAGFEVPSEGNILLDEEDITRRPASKRPMGMVFQSYALFPHMTAEQNIAFGMTIKHQPKDVIKRRCAELLELVGLGEKGNSYSHQLSGGQQQRIALARALAVEPKVLLLDEPLSALDAKVRVSLRNEIRRIQQQLKMTAIYVTHDQEEALAISDRIALARALAVEPKVLLLDEPLSALDAKVRVSLRNEIRRIQQQLKMTAIYVTHDQEEALAISDRIAVMAKGKIEQLDQPEEIYSNPRTVFAATFVGTSNHFRGVLESAAEGLCQFENQTLHVAPMQPLRDGDKVLVLVRPEEVTLSAANEAIDASVNGVGNHITGTIELRTFLGPFTRFHVRVNATNILTADIPSQQARDFFVAQKVVLSFAPNACQVLPLDAATITSVQATETEAEAV